MELNYQEIGERIRQIRKEKKMTQDDLGIKTNLTSSQVGNIENARSHPSLESLVTISEVLEISTDELLFGHIRFGEDRYLQEYNLLMLDCNEKEKEVLLEVMKTLKGELRRNHF